MGTPHFYLFLSLIVVLMSSEREVQAKTIPSANSDVTCIIEYLVHMRVIKEFDLKGKYHIRTPSDVCFEKMKKANSEFYRQMSKKTTGEKKIDHCIMSTIRQHNVTNMVLKEISMFHINGQSEDRIMRDLNTIKERIFRSAELICQHQGNKSGFFMSSHFSNFFSISEIFAPNINEKFDTLAENDVDINDIYEFNEIKHCVKDQIIKNEVIDVMKNSIDIRPRNIDKEDLEELDCQEVIDDLYNTMSKDIEELIRVSPVSKYVKTSCVVAKGESFKFLEKMFSYVFLIHSEMPKDMKNRVRRKADETEPSVARYTLECVNLY